MCSSQCSGLSAHEPTLPRYNRKAHSHCTFDMLVRKSSATHMCSDTREELKEDRRASSHSKQRRPKGTEERKSPKQDPRASDAAQGQGTQKSTRCQQKTPSKIRRAQGQGIQERAQDANTRPRSTRCIAQGQGTALEHITH
eukprot:2948186-Amphidinium_carterae.1